MSDLLPYVVEGTHVEYHKGKSNKFWRCYVTEGVWVAHWGACSAPVGQYKIFVTWFPQEDAKKVWKEKLFKGYGDSVRKTWAISEFTWSNIFLGQGLMDLGIRMDQLMGIRQLPVDDVIAGLQKIVADLS